MSRAWIVGGALRDELLGREVTDVDLAVEADPEAAARELAARVRGPVFPLSETFGAWRVIDHADGRVYDFSRLQGDTIDEDLAKRDFSINAMARPREGGELIDPLGGRADLDAGVLRVLGPDAYRSDPLRALRLARFASELGFRPDAETERLTREAASRVSEASGERVFAELRRLVLAPGVVEALGLADRLGVLGAVLPELTALHEVEQSRYHHLDVYEHTVEVLGRLLELEEGLARGAGLGPDRSDDIPARGAGLGPDRSDDVPARGAGLGPDRSDDIPARVCAALAEPLGDELSRGQALRFGALLHDIGKPATRDVRPDGRVTFMGHDRVGEEMVRTVCRRLRTSERLSRFLQSVTRQHLVLGFLVHERPLDRRTVYRYLMRTTPVEVEVTLLSCADRLATRGRKAEQAIAAHLELADELMEAALDWREAGPPRALVRGDRLAAELGLEQGPELGRLLGAVAEAAYAGELRTSEDAVEFARRVRDNPHS